MKKTFSLFFLLIALLGVTYYFEEYRPFQKEQELLIQSRPYPALNSSLPFIEIGTHRLNFRHPPLEWDRSKIASLFNHLNSLRIIRTLSEQEASDLKISFLKSHIRWPQVGVFYPLRYE